ASRPVALAGIMGGIGTEVSSSTQRVLLESAWFDPVTVRRSSRRLVLDSDSSYRFERRVDPVAVEAASQRFCQLLQDACGTRVLEGCLDACKEGFLEAAHPVISIRPARASLIMGIEIHPKEVERNLLALGFERVSGTDEKQEFRCPSYRADVTREIDLVEEVGRVHGFDSIEERPLTVFPTHASAQDELVEGLCTWMVGAGYHEALTYSFSEAGAFSRIEEWWSQASPLELRNPVRTQERYLRRSLLPKLLKAVRDNRNQGVERVCLFEVARVYHRQQGKGYPREALHLAWVDSRPDGSFRAARGVADGVLRHLQVARVLWSPFSQEGGLRPGESAGLVENGERLGLLGAADVEGVTGPVWCGELALAAFLERGSNRRVFQEYSRLPSIRRDVNVVLDEPIPWGEIEAAIESLNLPDLTAIDFADLYRGRQVPSGKKSLTFSLLFRSKERTLTHAEADQSTAQVIATLAKQFQAELRD
ncbi:MAG: phenylalanine--tRNA ligase subunit beta, partial [Planctomycetota bacterium]